jgi:hypothetical protein
MPKRQAACFGIPPAVSRQWPAFDPVRHWRLGTPRASPYSVTFAWLADRAADAALAIRSSRLDVPESRQ